MENNNTTEIIARAEKALQDLVDLIPQIQAHAAALRETHIQAEAWSPYADNHTAVLED